MFGYVRPAADRLTQEQTDLFRSAYCGLCRTLGRRYGLPARMILNYDLAFLAILLAGGSGFSCARHRCPVHPIRGCPCGEENPALDAAADLSVILTWWQLRDGVTDHGFFGGLKYRLAALLLRRSYRKAARLYHPDKNPDPSAAARFRDIQAAYELLADPARRRDYDLLRQRNLIDDPLAEATSLWASYIEKVIS